MKNALASPSSDFRAVRDGRRTQPFYVDVALDAAYTDASPLILPISGNSLYVDGRPTDGNVQIEFQDTSSDPVGVPFYVSPGFIYRGAFTQVRVTCAAQAGKKVRIIYGVDIDFQPGSVAQLALTGGVDLNVQTILDSRYTSVLGFQSVASIAAMLTNTPFTFFTAAQNVKGAYVNFASIAVGNGAEVHGAIIAKIAAPTGVNDDLVVGKTVAYYTAGANPTSGVNLAENIFIPAGLGLYAIASAGAVAECKANFKLL